MDLPKSKKARLIAYYLPQFHPIPENDEWWGKGFTEWTNVAKAKPLFPGHEQPHLPADLGFYDLRLPEVRAAQAALARENGIEGFCYYHYWFAGKQILERPLEEVIASGQPDFPFCLCWANETWSGRWHGLDSKILIEQTYPGIEDDTNHFYKLLKMFQDKRYIKVDGLPFLIIYKPNSLPRTTLELWRELALKEGLGGLFIVGVADMPWNYAEHGYDGATINPLSKVRLAVPAWLRPLRRLWRKSIRWPVDTYKYDKGIKYTVLPEGANENIFPCTFPNWDNTPRCGLRGIVLTYTNPESFRIHLRTVINQVKGKKNDKRIVMLKSWNEWAEGNYVEPDAKYGHGFLHVIKDEIVVSEN